jgi:hypothetical protein
MKRHLIAAVVGVAALFAAASPAAATSAAALDIWTFTIGYTCNNPSACGSDTLDGVWGTFDLDHDPATDVNTGSGRFAQCGHDGLAGCASVDEVISDWWAAPGSAGPDTVYLVGADTFSQRGERFTVPFGPVDIGFALMAGHYSATFRGLAVEVQISYKPAT